MITKKLLIKNKFPILIGFLLFVVALFLRVWRLSSAPDIFGDEALYTDIAINLPVYGQLVSYGEPWFVHPPLFFLVQSIFFQSVGISEVTLTNVFTARLPTCLWSSLTVLVVFVWITKASNYKIGTATALLLMFEPYSLRYGRIGIMDSMMIMFIVTSLYLFWKANDNGGFKRYVLAGVFFGLALLTKELAFYLFLPILIWWIITRYVSKVKVSIRKLSAFIGTSLLVYLGSFIWGLHLDTYGFLDAKIFLIKRVFWIIGDYTDYNNPRYTSFINDLIRVADIYIVSYILLALAPVACLYLIFREKSRISILLSSWFIGSAIFFGLIGVQNIKFFVYITMPAAVVVVYTLSKIHFRTPVVKMSEGWGSKSKQLLPFTCLTTVRSRLLPQYKVIIVILLAIMIMVNSGVWYRLYGIETDDALKQSIEWTQANIPEGTTIVARSYFDSFFLKNYTICAGTLHDITGQNIHYFILILHSNYYENNEDLLEYLTTNGKVICTFYGREIRQINIYYVKNPI